MDRFEENFKNCSEESSKMLILCLKMAHLPYFAQNVIFSKKKRVSLVLSVYWTLTYKKSEKK